MAASIINISKPVSIGNREWQPYRASGTVRSAHELLAPAGLDWEPEFQPLFTTPKGEPRSVEDWKAVCRSDNGDVLGIVKGRYNIIKNKELADFCDALRADAEEHSALMRFGNAGYYKNGAKPFIQLSRGVHKIGKVEVEDIISCFTAHDGSLNFTGGFSKIVIVCANTYAMALRDASGKWRHDTVRRHAPAHQDLLHPQP